MASGPSIAVKFLADTTNLVTGVDKAAGTASGKLGGFAKKAGLAIGGAFAVGAVVEFGKASVDAAAADAEGQAKLAQTLRNTTGATQDQIAASEDFISKLSKQSAIADDDLRPALSNLVRGFGNAEDAQKALALATDISAGTGKDLGSVSEALMKAANGQTGALGRLGIETKDSAGHAKSLDQIMGDLSSTFQGQAAQAADTTAGRMRNASIQFGEFQEKIGTAVLPVLATMTTFITGTLIPALSGIADWISGHKDLIIAGLVGVGVVVGAVVIPAFLTWAAAAGAAALATLAAAAPFIAIGAVIAGVAYLIIHNWDTIVSASETAWDAVTGAVKAAFGWVKDNWPLLLAIITGPIGAAVLIIVKNWDTIKGAAVAVFDWLSGVWQSITDIIAKPIQLAKDLIQGAWDGISTGAQAVFDTVKGIFDKFAGIFEGIVSAVSTAIGKVVAAITAPINAVIKVWNGLEFKIPEFTLPEFDTHIPGVGTIGGGKIGGMTIGFPDLPTLASGGLLTSPTLFLGGEAGTEIVAPEDMLRSIIREESGGGNYTLNMYPRTADAADIAYGFRRLELMAGLG